MNSARKLSVVLTHHMIQKAGDPFSLGIFLLATTGHQYVFCGVFAACSNFRKPSHVSWQHFCLINIEAFERIDEPANYDPRGVTCVQSLQLRGNSFDPQRKRCTGSSSLFTRHSTNDFINRRVCDDVWGMYSRSRFCQASAITSSLLKMEVKK